MDLSLLRDLFESRIISVCPPDRPFWMPGGKLSALSLCCCNLFGDSEQAASVSALIDTAKDTPMLLYPTVSCSCREAYEENGVYRRVIDALAQTVSHDPALAGVTHIAGCEGTGLLLSARTAELLQKPHLTVLGNKEVYVTQNAKTTRLNRLDGQRVLFITDVFAENSEFFKCWLPALKLLGSNTLLALALIDRAIGGSDRLVGEGVYCQALFEADGELFSAAHREGLISGSQLELLRAYLHDPYRSMVDFLAGHPDFLQLSLQSRDPVAVERAKLCVQRGLYQLSDTQA